MRIDDYIEYKNKNLIAIRLKEENKEESINDGIDFICERKKFDTNTGKELSPVIEYINIDSLIFIKNSLLKQIENIDMIINDCNILNK